MCKLLLIGTVVSVSVVIGAMEFAELMNSALDQWYYEQYELPMKEMGLYE